MGSLTKQGNRMVAQGVRQRRSRLFRLPSGNSGERKHSVNDFTETSEVSESNWSSRSVPPANIKPAIRLDGSASRDNQKKAVNFGSIEIREHEIILDYHPVVSCGPAIGLGWESIDLPRYSVDDFELGRGPRRLKTEFQLPRYEREEILREFGYSRGEISDACKLIDVAKKQRRLSIATQDVECTQIAMEWTSRRVKRLIGMRSSYQIEEAELWKNAHLRMEQHTI